MEYCSRWKNNNNINRELCGEEGCYHVTVRRSDTTAEKKQCISFSEVDGTMLFKSFRKEKDKDESHEINIFCMRQTAVNRMPLDLAFT